MSDVAVTEEYRAGREGAAFFETSAALIVVSGADRAAYLQGLLTNDIAGLGAGDGCYAAYLTPQGRMITDLWVHELGDVMLLRMQPAVAATVLSKLDQFIFTEDVQVGDATASFARVAVVGPMAASVVAHALDVAVDRLPAGGEGRNARVTFEGDAAIVVRPTSIGADGIELLVPAERIERVRQGLQAAGATQIGSSTADVLRVEEGRPLFGVDMNEETIPLEAGIESRAISFTKGCYVGQEVIIRVLHRGHGRVARKLVGIVFEGDTPAVAGMSLRSADAEIGLVTSGVVSPALGRSIALGYVKRDFAAPGTAVMTGAGTAGEVVALPFSR